jgi:hydroxymethylglutaryl-CoA lyase
MSDQVRIVEVGPRDGLQNEKTPVSADEDRVRRKIW